MLTELNNEWIRDILDNMEDAVCATSMGGELLYANPAAEKLFGLDMDRQAKIWEAIPYVEDNDALIQLFIDGVMKKKGPIRSLVEYVNNEGKRFNLHVTLTCEPTDAGMILIVIHDLTDLTKVHSAFERYTSPEIADYVLTTPDGEKQGGQDREVSILMSDLRGFTALSTRLSCDDLITMLNHYFEAMAEVIRRHRGTVIEFLGDGIFVVFGAPQEMPGHAGAAVSCAVGMQNAMAEVNAWNSEHGYPALEMGIGVHSGPVVVGNIGSERKMKYGCMGETVNLAGRLESLTLGGEICISEHTRKMIPHEVPARREDTFMPKGGREMMKYYSITGAGPDCVLKSAGEAIRWRNLPAALETVVYILEGKQVGTEAHAGTLAAISEDERYGLLNTETALQPMQNLMLRTGGLEAYAKVTDRTQQGCVICFTMKPEGFSGLFS